MEEQEPLTLVEGIIVGIVVCLFLAATASIGYHIYSWDIEHEAMCQDLGYEAPRGSNAYCLERIYDEDNLTYVDHEIYVDYDKYRGDKK